MFDNTTFLKRISYFGELNTSLEVLGNLQKTHLIQVPFENLDIHYGHPIILDINKIFEKIVINGRGGFCYELNGLFYALLGSLGFETKRISGRVYNNTKGYSKEYDHCAIIVTINGSEYLTDVGFGEFTFAPLKLELDTIQHDERGDYVIKQFDNEYFQVNKNNNGQLVPEYIFKSVHRSFNEFEDMSNYHQSNPESHFAKKKMISIPTENGRMTLSSNQLKITDESSVTKIDIKNEIEFSEKLLDIFNIKISSSSPIT